MSRPVMPPPTLIAVAIGLGAIALAAPLALLPNVARPAGFDRRTAAVSAQIDRARALTSAPGDAGAYAKGALCAGPIERAGSDLSRRVAAAAAAAGLQAPVVRASLHRLDFQRGIPNIELQVEADGRYDAVVAMLGRLAATEPDIFVDTLDLQPHVTAVSLKLTGHLYCRAPAPN